MCQIGYFAHEAVNGEVSLGLGISERALSLATVDGGQEEHVMN